MCPSDAVKPGLSCCAATAPAARGTIHSRPEIGAAALKAPEVPVTVRFSHVSVQVSYVYPAGGEPNVQVHAHAATVRTFGRSTKVRRTGPSSCARASRKFNSLDPTPRTEKHLMKPTAYQTFILCALAAAALAGCSSGTSVNPRAGASASASATATAPDTDNASPSSSTKPKPASITPSTLPPPTVVTIPAADGGGSSSNGNRVVQNVPAQAHAKAGTTGVPTGVQSWATDKHGAVSFLTPTGNIGCDVISGDSMVVCMLKESQWTEKVDSPGIDPKTGKPVQRRAFQLQLKADGSSQVTAPGGVNGAMGNRSSTKTLQYGQMLHVGTFVCASEQNGVTCWNHTTGHGVFLNRTEHITF